MKKVFVIFGLFFFVSLFSQENDSIEDDFLNYKKQEDLNFQKFKDARDKEFSNFLKKEWEEMHLSKPQKVLPEKPKPIAQPVISVKRKNLIKSNPKIKSIGIQLPKIVHIPEQKINIPKPKVVIEEEKEKKEILNVNFYDANIQIPFDSKFKIKLKKITEKAIANYWVEMSKTQYFSFLKASLAIKEKYQLNDWAYYLFLKKTASEIYQKENKNEQTLFVWYMLTKAGYQCKVARIDTNINLLVTFENKVFSKPYIICDGKKYYILDSFRKGYRVYTYKESYPDTDLVMNLNIYQPLKLGEQFNTKKLSFNYKNKTHIFKIPYSASNILFYSDVLSSDFDVYFEGQINDLTFKSLKNQLDPLLVGKSTKEKLNTILRFVQTAFDYKTDDVQFGKEKYFFVEEIFHYDFSDCEDRSVLFAYLVRNILGLKVIGLNYPGHIATAVQVNEEINGDFLTYKNEKYIVCDPTYINADAGMTMPKFKNQAPKVIVLK